MGAAALQALQTRFHFAVVRGRHSRATPCSEILVAPDVATHAGACPSYGYDVAGRVVEMTYPSGRVVSFTRDSTGRVASVTTKANPSTTAESVATGIEYLPFYPAGLFADGAAAPGLDMPHLDGLAGFTHGNGLALLLNVALPDATGATHAAM